MFSTPDLCGGYAGKTHSKYKFFPCGALPDPILVDVCESNFGQFDFG